MHFRTLLARRRMVGRLGTLCICLALLLALDGMVAGGRKDPKLIETTPGNSLNLTDPMPRGVEKLEDLDLRIAPSGLPVTLVETFSGFWLGGTLWRARADVPADAAPGDYALSMFLKTGAEAAPPQRYRIRVHKDAAAAQAASLSLTTRALGVSPYMLALCALALTLLPALGCLSLSRGIAQALRDEGLSEVFRAMAGPEGQRITFARPGGNPIAAGALVEVLDERGETVLGSAVVTGSNRGDAEAVMQAGVNVRPGALARIT